jgi:hypothetical protein
MSDKPGIKEMRDGGLPNVITVNQVLILDGGQCKTVGDRIINY